MKIQITLILLAILHTHTTAAQQQEDQKLIEATCRKTPNYQLCVSTLRSDRRSSTADAAGLSLIVVTAAKAKAESAVTIIRKLESTRPGSMLQCEDAYDFVLKTDVPQAAAALAKRNARAAENGVVDVVKQSDICGDSFRGVDLPLGPVNQAVRDLADVARAIIGNI